MGSTIDPSVSTAAFVEDFDEVDTVDNIERLTEVLDLNFNRYRDAPSHDIDQFYNSAKRFVKKFDEVVEEFVEEIDKETIEQSVEEIEGHKEEIEATYDEVGKIFADVEESLLKDLKSKNTYLLAKKFYGLSCIYIKEVLSRTDEIEDGLDNLTEEEVEERAENRKESIGFGMIVAHQPYLLCALLIADRKGDQEFMERYSDLIDRYATLVARNAPETYLEVMDSDNIEFNNSRSFEEFK